MTTNSKNALSVRVAAAIALLSLISPAAAAQYSLVDDYRPGTFYDHFSFFTETDPTAGSVVYDSFDNASAASLIAYTPYSTIMRVDSTNVVPGDQGRPSVRITSNKAYNHGMLIADILHMPPSLCGLWPALWMTGPDWPKGGEIDIIEGVNTQTANLMTLHTTNDCVLTGTAKSNMQAGTKEKRDDSSASYSANMLGSVSTSSCWNDDPNQSANAGCQIAAPAPGTVATVGEDIESLNRASALTAPETYGSGLNTQQGGVVAMEWTSDAITIWLWSRSSLPASIAAATNLSNNLAHPDPTDADWGVPLAVFGGSGCNLDDHISDQQIVVNIDFCGSWAGDNTVWATANGDQPSCAATTGSDCASYVRNNPGAFVDAFWEFGAFRWFETGGKGGQVVTVESAGAAGETTSASASVSAGALNATIIANATYAVPASNFTTNTTLAYPTANATNNTNATFPRFWRSSVPLTRKDAENSIPTSTGSIRRAHNHGVGHARWRNVHVRG